MPPAHWLAKMPPPGNQATEQKWLTTQIGRQLAETVAFAHTRKLPDSSGLTFSSTPQTMGERFAATMTGAPEVRSDFILSDYLWAPANFIPWTQKLLATWTAPVPPAAAPDLAIFQRLATPRQDMLVREDRRLSEALTKAPLDPQLHEEAALLIGSFALREAAAEFCDTRREMCAMSAHLALARAIRRESSSAGELAEAILCTLSGREAAASAFLTRLRLTAEAPGGMTLNHAQTWERALQMRNTGDYRLLDKPQNYSLLERLEYFRALRSSISTAAAENYLLKSKPERLAEWPLVILAGDITVADGNHWTQMALAANLEEAASEYQSYFGKAASGDELVDALNAEPAYFILGRENQPACQVLGWGSWARLRQRQLCSLLTTTWYWIDQSLGLPEQAREFREKLADKFSGLDLYPLVKFFQPEKDAAAQRDYAAAVQTLLREHPDRVTFRLARDIIGPAAMIWFSPILPFGTTYDLGYRNVWHPLQMISPAELDRLKAAAPHNYIVLNQHALTTHPPSPTSAQLREEFAPIMYHTDALWRIANASKNDPAAYQSVFARICELDPDYYTTLGQYLVEHNLAEAAAIAYQKAVDFARDRVRVANQCRWLADYYYDRGRREEALAIADMAADVFSSAGLQTAAHIMERDGRLDKAEGFLQKQAERYRQPGTLTAFYARHREKDPRFATEYDKHLAKIFPEGMPRPIDPGSLTGAPPRGMMLRTVNPKAAALGLKIGDVIVAINGTPVTTMDQYTLVIDSAPDSHIRFTTWNGTSYTTAAADLPDRRLGVDLLPLHR